MAKTTIEQEKEANKLILELRRLARSQGLETPNWNSVLWRYLDLPKFVSMLSKKALPMIRIDKFEDKWEGFSAPLEDKEYYGFFAQHFKQTDSERFQQGEQLRKFYYASCWHMSDIESDAMWKLYMSGNEGLAIRTTYQKLIYSLRDVSQEFLIGKVRYQKKPRPGLSMLLTCMTKREPFLHEREVRVIRHDADAEKAYRNENVNPEERPSVIWFDCDFKQLIEKVTISPKAGSWFIDAISDMLQKYGLPGDKVSQSELSGEPQWPKKKIQ